MKKPKTVTQIGVTTSQPGICVSTHVPAYDENYNIIAGAKLSVFRAYDKLPNEFGGIGIHKRCDGDGKLFKSHDEAMQWAFEHGYIREYFRNKTPQEKARTAQYWKEFLQKRKLVVG
jgi:hypothetical protein